MNYDEQLHLLISNALQEDIGNGDHSTNSTIDEGEKGTAFLKVKENGVLAGMHVAETIFKFLEPAIEFKPEMKDGQTMNVNDIAFTVTGTARTILSCERLVLNCMQRMSGIATLTKKYVDKLHGYHTKILDTRKTTPNFRLLEKEAVRVGDGINHRFGLYDMIMLKDNHIDFCGGIEKAILKANEYLKTNSLNLKIEVETRTIEDVIAVVNTGGVHRIMLDNFTPEKITEALRIINGQFETEASGGIHFDNLASYAATGVDYISSGAIIHQATSLDLSLKAKIL